MKTSSAFMAVLLGLIAFLFSSKDVHAKNQSFFLGFDHASCFNADFSEYPARIRYFGNDDVRLVPFGPTVINWTVTLAFFPDRIEFVEGAFVFTFKSGKTVSGHYSGATVNPLTGDYTLEWTFTEGSGGVFEMVDEGLGETAGVVDLFTFCAQYQFSGMLTMDPTGGAAISQAARKAAKSAVMSLKH